MSNSNSIVTAVRSEEKGPFDVTLSTPSRKTPVKSSFNGNGIVEERTEVLYDVDPEETLTLKLFDEGSEEEVKYVQIPVKSLTAEVTSTFLVHDGISVSFFECCHSPFICSCIGQYHLRFKQG